MDTSDFGGAALDLDVSVSVSGVSSSTTTDNNNNVMGGPLQYSGSNNSINNSANTMEMMNNFGLMNFAQYASQQQHGQQHHHLPQQTSASDLTPYFPPSLEQLIEGSTNDNYSNPNGSMVVNLTLLDNHSIDGTGTLHSSNNSNNNMMMDLQPTALYPTNVSSEYGSQVTVGNNEQWNMDSSLGFARSNSNTSFDSNINNNNSNNATLLSDSNNNSSSSSNIANSLNRNSSGGVVNNTKRNSFSAGTADATPLDFLANNSGTKVQFVNRRLVPDELFMLLTKPFAYGLKVWEEPLIPQNGVLYLIDTDKNARFRKDNHDWQQRNSNSTAGKNVREDHQKLKYKGQDAMTVYYSRSKTNPNFYRRIYALTEKSPFRLVHYLEDADENQSLKPSPNQSGSLTASPSPGSKKSKPVKVSNNLNSTPAHLINTLTPSTVSTPSTPSTVGEMFLDYNLGQDPLERYTSVDFIPTVQEVEASNVSGIKMIDFAPSSAGSPGEKAIFIIDSESDPNAWSENVKYFVHFGNHKVEAEIIRPGIIRCYTPNNVSLEGDISTVISNNMSSISKPFNFLFRKVAEIAVKELLANSEIGQQPPPFTLTSDNSIGNLFGRNEPPTMTITTAEQPAKEARPLPPSLVISDSLSPAPSSYVDQPESPGSMSIRSGIASSLTLDDRSETNINILDIDEASVMKIQRHFRARSKNKRVVSNAQAMREVSIAQTRETSNTRSNQSPIEVEAETNAKIIQQAFRKYKFRKQEKAAIVIQKKFRQHKGAESRKHYSSHSKPTSNDMQ